MNPIGATTSTTSVTSVTSTTSTTMKLFLLVTACIVINIFLYLIEDKWIGGLFSGAWLFAIVLTYLYNNGFDLNITNYSFTTLLKRYFLPILTYIAWIGVIYWLITAEIDINQNIKHSQLSRNFAGVMTGFIPVLAGIVTYYSTYGKSVGWAILNSIVLLVLGSYGYYIYTLWDGCDKNVSDTICWTRDANLTFLGFIIITGFFIWLSTKNLAGFAKCIQFLPRILTTNPTSPLSIFSIIIYLIMWISSIIIYFRRDNGFSGDTVNLTFTIIGIVMIFLLFSKETLPSVTNFINKFINLLITYIYNQHLSTILLHLSIYATLIASSYFTFMYWWTSKINFFYFLLFALILLSLFIFYLVLLGWKS
jgi:hypothetical protein